MTILKASSGGTITRSNLNVQAHYKIRILVSGWWLSGSNNIDISIASPSLSPPQDDIIVATAQQLNSSTYCAGSRATNFD